jgi:hypothetical protein
MNDIDALLKEFEQPKKPNKKENFPQSQKLPVPNLSTFPKQDFSISDTRKGLIPNPNFSLLTEQGRPSILKQPSKPFVEQSLDIDAILQGHSIQPQQSSKVLHPIAPAKNSAALGRRDSLSDWLNEDRSNAKNHSIQPSNLFPQKVTTNASGKPAIDSNPDDFFSNTHNRDQSATRAPLAATKPSAKQYYLGSSRYKPGKNSMPSNNAKI